MREIEDYIPITKAKNILLEIIRRVERDDETIAITKKGTPIAIILSMGKFKGLLETLDILSDEEAMLSLQESIQEEIGSYIKSTRPILPSTYIMSGQERTYMKTSDGC